MLYLSYALSCPSALSSTLTLLRLVSSCNFLSLITYVELYILEEGDGRCVRASGPSSIKRSILNLLLNPPSVLIFISTFV